MYHVVKKQQWLYYDWILRSVFHSKLSALLSFPVTLREALHKHQKTCYDMKIHNLLFSDPKTMWIGYLSVTQTTEIVTSSLEGEIDIKPIFACHYTG